MSAKTSPCARATSGQWAASVMNMRVRTTCSRPPPALVRASLMRSRHSWAWAYASAGAAPPPRGDRRGSGDQDPVARHDRAGETEDRLVGRVPADALTLHARHSFIPARDEGSRRPSTRGLRTAGPRWFANGRDRWFTDSRAGSTGLDPAGVGLARDHVI